MSTYKDVVIKYDESDNLWRFTLRDRDRTADSLLKAREFIDKPIPQNERKPFKRIPVWFTEYGNLPKRAEITGIAERRSYGDYVWINCEGQRSKQVVRSLFPQNAKNNKLIEQIIAKEEEKRTLEEAISELEGKLVRLELPKDE